MRNYVNELLNNGMSVRTIAKQAGISVRQVNGLSIGMTRLKSGTKAYEAIRNISRRTEYGQARKAGMTAKQASVSRRILLRPETLVKNKTRKVEKSLHGQSFFQLILNGTWQKEHTKKKLFRIINSASAAHHEKFDLKPILETFDEGGWEALHGELGYGEAHHTEFGKDAFDECIIQARGQLGDSNWKLVKINRLTWVKVVLTE